MSEHNLSREERDVMEHATGWRSKQPLYRNHYVAGPGHHSMPQIEALVARGLMYQSRDDTDRVGATYAVDAAGIEALKAADVEDAVALDTRRRRADATIAFLRRRANEPALVWTLEELGNADAAALLQRIDDLEAACRRKDVFVEALAGIHDEEEDADISAAVLRAEVGKR
jgi:hypothetical protein